MSHVLNVEIETEYRGMHMYGRLFLIDIIAAESIVIGNNYVPITINKCIYVSLGWNDVTFDRK